MPTTTLQLRLTTDGLIATARDAAGEVIAEAFSSVETRAPDAGWKEQRPEDWWDALTATLAALRKSTSLTAATTITVASDFAAAAFLDGEREVIRPAVLEGDVRGPHPFTWLRQHQPIAYKRVQHLLQPADYLRLMLTGEITTTPADAERTGLFDSVARAWDEHQCDELEINIELLPTIRRNTAPILVDLAAVIGVSSVVAVG